MKEEESRVRGVGNVTCSNQLDSRCGRTKRRAGAGYEDDEKGCVPESVAIRQTRQRGERERERARQYLHHSWIYRAMSEMPAF